MRGEVNKEAEGECTRLPKLPRLSGVAPAAAKLFADGEHEYAPIK